MLGRLPDIARGLPNGAALSSLGGGFALWASVSEGRSTRVEATRDLLLLSAAAAMGAASYIGLAPLLACLGRAGPELTRRRRSLPGRLSAALPRLQRLASTPCRCLPPALGKRCWEARLASPRACSFRRFALRLNFEFRNVRLYLAVHEPCETLPGCAAAANRRYTAKPRRHRCETRFHRGVV